MAAANTDKLKKLSRKWVGQIGAAGVSDASVTTIPLSSSTNLATDTAVVATIDRVDANGTKTASLEESVIGVVSGNNLVNCVRGSEGTAQAHSAGAVVEILVTAKGWNDIVDWALVQHLQDGNHGDVCATSLSVVNNIDIVSGKSIRDGNDNELVKFSQTTSAVNEFTVANAATGNGVTLSATGGDTDIDINITPKGTGSTNITKAEFPTQAYFDAEVDNGNSGTADTVDWTAGNKQKSTLTGNCTFTFTAPSGPCNLILKLIQDGTGSRVVTWPNTVKWPAGTAPKLTTAASSVDIVAFYYDGTNYHGQASLAFAVPA